MADETRLIAIGPEAGREEWQAWLEQQPEASIYHTPLWQEILSGAFGYQPCYLFARDRAGELEGMLPLFLLEAPGRGKRLCSAPFAHCCGPLGSVPAVSALLQQAAIMAAELRVAGLEIRSPVPLPAGRTTQDFVGHILPLSSDYRQVWEALGSGSIRRGIKRAEKTGVIVKPGRSAADWREFYRLNSLTKHRLGVPCHPWRYLDLIRALGGEQAGVYLAWLGDRPIGGAVMLYCRHTVLYAYGGADPAYLAYRPYNAIFWSVIRDACAAGYQSLDFGRTERHNQGLLAFKRRWGTTEIPLLYSVSGGRRAGVGAGRQGVLYRSATGFFRSLPLPIYTRLSERIFSWLG